MDYYSINVGDKLNSISMGGIGIVLAKTRRTLTIKWSKCIQKITFNSNNWSITDDYDFVKTSH